MRHSIKDQARRFAWSENGAVTLDWIVLTAALVGIGVLVALSITSLAGDPAGRIRNALSSIDTTN